MKKILTLCMVCKDNKILLGMKKRGFGEGRWNGFGGKIDEGESIEAGARREVVEEVGIEPVEMRKVGIIEFSFESDPKILQVHIFKASDYTGNPEESGEMKPQWFAYNEIPFQQMWPDDEYWVPHLLEDKLFKGEFHFDRPSNTEYSSKILSHKLIEVDEV